MEKVRRVFGVRKEARVAGSLSSLTAAFRKMKQRNVRGQGREIGEKDTLRVCLVFASSFRGKAASAFAQEKSRPRSGPFFQALPKTTDAILTRLYVFGATATHATSRKHDTP
jgi:hypothetical protein